MPRLSSIACAVLALAVVLPSVSARVVEQATSNDAGAVLSHCDADFNLCVFLSATRVVSGGQPATLLFYSIWDYQNGIYREGFGTLPRSALTGTPATGMTLSADTAVAGFVNETCDLVTGICTPSAGGIVQAQWTPTGFFSFRETFSSRFTIGNVTFRSSGVRSGVSALASATLLGLYSFEDVAGNLATNHNTSITIEKP